MSSIANSPSIDEKRLSPSSQPSLSPSLSPSFSPSSLNTTETIGWLPSILCIVIGCCLCSIIMPTTLRNGIYGT